MPEKLWLEETEADLLELKMSNETKKNKTEICRLTKVSSRFAGNRARKQTIC
jgi:hypothetical protein